MTRTRIIGITVGGGLLVFLGVWGWQQFRPSETTSSGSEALVSTPAPPPATDAPSLAPAVEENPPTPPVSGSSASWQDTLAALQGRTGEVAGQQGEERMKELQTFAESVSLADLPAAMKMLQELQAKKPTEMGRDLQMRLVRQWGDKDVNAAAAWATTMPTGNDRQEALSALGGIWARKSFDEAAAWAEKLPAGAERNKVLESVAYEVIYTDPIDALNLVGSLPAGEARNEIVMNASSTWADTAPQEAIAWAQKVPDKGLREQVTSAIAIKWGEKDPVAAGQLAAKSLPAGPVQDKTVIAIVERWAFTNEAAAKAWVEKFPEGELRKKALETVEYTGKRSRKEVLY